MTPIILGQVELSATNLLIAGILSILAGILILIVPRVLNYVVALYLIVVGVLWVIAGL